MVAALTDAWVEDRADLSRQIGEVDREREELEILRRSGQQLIVQGALLQKQARRGK